MCDKMSKEMSNEMYEHVRKSLITTIRERSYVNEHAKKFIVDAGMYDAYMVTIVENVINNNEMFRDIVKTTQYAKYVK